MLAVLLGATIVVNYATFATTNTAQTHFDAIIVLGFPANRDGTPAPEQRERVLAGVSELRRGVAPKLIVTGGAVHNRFTEAHAMALLAQAHGVPAADIVEEPQAQNTIQNIFYAATIMHQHGWHSAEVISSPSHLPRAALILTTFDRLHPDLAIAWATHPAPWPHEYSFFRKLVHYAAESSYCLKLRVMGFPPSRFLPSR